MSGNGNNGTFHDDVNGDELVDLVDLLVTVDYILEKNPQAFYFWCADVIDDVKINIMDIVTFRWWVNYNSLFPFFLFPL